MKPTTMSQAHGVNSGSKHPSSSAAELKFIIGLNERCEHDFFSF